MPAFLLPVSSTPGLTVCVRLPAPCLPATCQFNSRSHSRCPSTCSLRSCYLPVQLQVTESVSVYMLTAFQLSANTTPGLKVGVRQPAPCLPATCQFNSRSHSRCPFTYSLPSCYLPIQLQVSQSVSVYLLPAFVLPANSTHVLTVCVLLPAACFPASCQFDSRS